MFLYIEDGMNKLVNISVSKLNSITIDKVQ